jgi:ubiquinone/menaquinone biosynthesis C-methylase UbiE
MNHEERAGYNLVARHFDVEALPRLLREFLPAGPLALADFGCGDGPFFSILERMGYISQAKPVYAVDLQEERLLRVLERVPFVTTVAASAEAVPSIPDGSLDLVISTMVMEHVVDEKEYLDEMRRVLAPGGRIYLTTVFKRRWAWYFRRRQGQSVLDVSHLREYTDLRGFTALLMQGNRFSTLLALELSQLWFPLVDPFLFRATKAADLPSSSLWLRVARLARVPIPGYYTLSAVVQA